MAIYRTIEFVHWFVLGVIHNLKQYFSKHAKNTFSDPPPQSVPERNRFSLVSEIFKRKKNATFLFMIYARKQKLYLSFSKRSVSKA